MSVSAVTERRMLTENEFELVARTHYPDISELSREDLTEAARRLRDYRDKARDIARHQRREMRGKAAPRGAQPARDNTGTTIKKQIFAQALKRVNRELARFKQADRQESQADIARRALALKRANRARHHPGAGRTAATGMSVSPNPKRSVNVDPREVGRVSQFVKQGQARRDG
ncbi:MAG: hypothetical protein EA406_02400 [Rhodospirillales bacterium]|nr:MAG: hypothetical protein EA406_02400 [Rhodospirillales bacterium]